MGRRKACREAGVPDKLGHDFRQTTVRNMVRAGILERAAMQMAGHKTRSILDRHHIASDGDLQEATKGRDTAFRSPLITKAMTTASFAEESQLSAYAQVTVV